MRLRARSGMWDVRMSETDRKQVENSLSTRRRRHHRVASSGRRIASPWPRWMACAACLQRLAGTDPVSLLSLTFAVKTVRYRCKLRYVPKYTAASRCPPGGSTASCSVCSFLQRVSIACYAERCISYGKSVRPSVRPSVCPSVRHMLALSQNDSSYDHGVFTVG